jgi:hypothetical protein
MGAEKMLITVARKAGPMPRYYFNLRNGEEIIKDPQGLVLPNIRAAQKAARTEARELSASRVNAHRPIEDEAVEIADDRGATLDSFPLGEPLDGR